MSYHGQNVLAIIQARMESSRLPEKILKDIGGLPMLGWVVQRASMANTVDRVLVATTESPQDDAVVDFCDANHIGCTRGSQHDVLDRYYRAALQHQPDWVVRLTADCPLLDPQLLDRTVRSAWLDASEPQFAFTTNRLPEPWGRTYPIGLDVEVMSFQGLERAWHETSVKHEREHVTPYFYETAPPDDPKIIPGWGRSWFLEDRGFDILLLDHPQDFGEIRWTVDTPQDLQLVRELAARLPKDRVFTWLDVLHIYQSDPELASINSMIVHRTHFDTDERA